MSHRSDQLLSAVKTFNAAWDAWVADVQREYPDPTLFDAFDEMLAVFERGNIPGDCRRLSDCVVKLGKEYEAYGNRENPGEFRFHEALKARRGELAELMADKAAPPLKLLETIADLRKQGCNDLQIAGIYEFRDRHGYAIPALVELEFKTPGSVTATRGAVGGRDWQAPEGFSGFSDGTKFAPWACSVVSEATEEDCDTADVEPVCPETPFELWQQKVSVEQAAKMLQKPVEEAAELFAGFAAPPNQDPPVVPAVEPAKAAKRGKGKQLAQAA